MNCTKKSWQNLKWQSQQTGDSHESRSALPHLLSLHAMSQFPFLTTNCLLRSIPVWNCTVSIVLRTSAHSQSQKGRGTHVGLRMLLCLTYTMTSPRTMANTGRDTARVCAFSCLQSRCQRCHHRNVGEHSHGLGALWLENCHRVRRIRAVDYCDHWCTPIDLHFFVSIS